MTTSEFNPFEPPSAEAMTGPHDLSPESNETIAWRDGEFLVLRSSLNVSGWTNGLPPKGPRPPERCLICNSPKSMDWCSINGRWAPSLIGSKRRFQKERGISFSLTQNVFYYGMNIPLCRRHFWGYELGLIFRLVLLILLLPFSVLILDFLWPSSMLVLEVVSMLCVVVFFFVWREMSNFKLPIYLVEEGCLWIKGVHPDYLAALPEWPGWVKVNEAE